jgi:hypothetical protein
VPYDEWKRPGVFAKWFPWVMGVVLVGIVFWWLILK